ncbi:MAG: alpha/beta fold hydrolase [Micavibrio sp.]|nr:alpha/beta fold hydrolase [Micavibrio sp.]
MSRAVIVLHGIAMNRMWMAGMARHLRGKHYTVYDISYPSREKTFDQLVDDHITPVVKEAFEKSGQPVDFVVHSMGGLLVRYYAQKYGAAKIGRVVMIGTPNRGSEVADFLRRFPPFEWYFGVAGQTLGTTADDIHAKLPPVPFECGIIAGRNHYFHFPTSYIVDIPRPNDGLVSIDSTKVDGMKDHVVIFGDHSLMVWMPGVWKLASQFLGTGSFKDAA